MVRALEKLEGEYATLVNTPLDHLPVENSEPESFEVVAEALRSITDHEHHHNVPNSLKDKVSCIQEYIDTPELYVEKRANDAEFKEIILRRVASKIKELTSFNNDERKAYVKEQQERCKQIGEQKAQMTKAKPPEPGTPAHVLSDQEFIRYEVGRILHTLLEGSEDPSPQENGQESGDSDFGVDSLVQNLFGPLLLLASINNAAEPREPHLIMRLRVITTPTPLLDSHQSVPNSPHPREEGTAPAPQPAPPQNG